MRTIWVRGKRTVRLYEQEKRLLENAEMLCAELATSGPSGVKETSDKARIYLHALGEQFKKTPEAKGTEDA